MATPRIISRAEWGARAALDRRMTQTPVAHWWIHHAVVSCNADPYQAMRQIENHGVSQWGRFPYSWAFSVTGLIFEGAGVTRGVHTAYWNHNSFGSAFIAQHHPGASPPACRVTDEEVEAAAALIVYQIELGRVRPGVYIGPHSEATAGTAYATACPGDYGRARIPDIRALVRAGGPGPSPVPLPPSTGETFTMSQMDTLGQWMQEQAALNRAHLDRRLKEQDARWSLVIPTVIAKTAEATAKAIGAADTDGAPVEVTVDTAALKAAVVEAIGETRDVDLDELADHVADELAGRLQD